MPDQTALDAKLIAAVIASDTATAARLLDRGASPNAVEQVTWPEMSGWYRDTPVLYTACRMQRVDMVALLLDHGADPNAILTAHENMLHEKVPCLFMAFPSVEITELLLRAGADPNKPRWQKEDVNWDRFALGEAHSGELKALLRRYGAREGTKRCR